MSDHTRVPHFPPNLEDYAPWVTTRGLVAPYGECQCGCGRATNISKKDDRKSDVGCGQPYRFFVGHSQKTVGTPIILARQDSPNDTCKIPLTRGFVAIVDATDYERLSQFRWHVSKEYNRFYAHSGVIVPSEKKALVIMHREILAAPRGVYVDHLDGDGLNNTRGNLRLCTNSENLMNRGATKFGTSGYKGVTWNKKSQKWQAQIEVNGVARYLGLFVDKEDAARAYDAAAREFHGMFAYLNFEAP